MCLQEDASGAFGEGSSGAFGRARHVKSWDQTIILIGNISKEVMDF